MFIVIIVRWLTYIFIDFIAWDTNKTPINVEEKLCMLHVTDVGIKHCPAGLIPNEREISTQCWFNVGPES